MPPTVSPLALPKRPAAVPNPPHWRTNVPERVNFWTRNEYWSAT